MGKKAKAEAVKEKTNVKAKAAKEDDKAPEGSMQSDDDGGALAAAEAVTETPTQEGTINGKVKYESSLPRDEAIAYFEAIVKGLKKGQIQFKQGDQNVIVAPAEYLEVEVKAARKGQKEKVSFEISWRTDAHADLTVA